MNSRSFTRSGAALVMFPSPVNRWTRSGPQWRQPKLEQIVISRRARASSHGLTSFFSAVFGEKSWSPDQGLPLLDWWSIVINIKHRHLNQTYSVFRLCFPSALASLWRQWIWTNTIDDKTLNQFNINKSQLWETNQQLRVLLWSWNESRVLRSSSSSSSSSSRSSGKEKLLQGETLKIIGRSEHNPCRTEALMFPQLLWGAATGPDGDLLIYTGNTITRPTHTSVCFYWFIACLISIALDVLWITSVSLFTVSSVKMSFNALIFFEFIILFSKCLLDTCPLYYCTIKKKEIHTHTLAENYFYNIKKHPLFLQMRTDAHRRI